MAISSDFFDLRLVCKRVMSCIDELAKIESLKAQNRHADDANPDGTLRDMGIDPSSAPKILRERVSAKLGVERDELFVKSIEVSADKLTESVESLQCEMQKVTKGVVVFGGILDGDRVDEKQALGRLVRDGGPQRVTVEYHSMFGDWLVECAEAVEDAQSQKAILIRLVMGALAQFKDGVMPADLRMSLPWMPIEVSIEGAKQPLGVLSTLQESILLNSARIAAEAAGPIIRPRPPMVVDLSKIEVALTSPEISRGCGIG